MKKLALLLIIFLFSFFIEGYLGYVGIAENENDGNSVIVRIKKEMERKAYLINLIQQIEAESEVIIPNYVDIKYVEYMYDLSKKLELPTRMVFRLVYKESYFINTNVSREGAKGFFQVMPNTYKLYAEMLNIDTLKLDDNQKNIYIGMYMLKDLYVFWTERGNSEKYSWKLCLASYNAGMGKVLHYHGIPPYDETISYIKFILQPPLNSQLVTTNYFAKK
jgi:soluble lytic murein transglycosylase-like protein